MTKDSQRGVSRRKFIAAASAFGVAGAMAGCSEGSGSTPDENSQNLTAGGSSTVYPVANDAASYWNGNRPASDSEYWPHEEYDIDTDKNLADYWAGLYGIEGTGSETEPPFNVSVALSHSGTGVKDVRDGKIDIGNSSGNVEDELPDRDSYENFIDNVVAVDGQPLVVSTEIAEAGVDSITGDQLKDLYKGRISNWSELGGPDRDIQVLGRAKGSGTRTSFVSNVFNDPEADTTVATRFGQNQRLASAISDADNAISYIALAFLDTDGLEPISLEWEGTTYTYGADENGLDATSYPLSRDLHMYTWEEVDSREAAFVNMMLSDFGQDTFVAPNNYFRLGASRREEQRNLLPEQSN
ncbi:phosphate ABC transporter substrate-binding protein [Halapricum sp. CBA1109]|uniref:substrate-binding domain-containing protein n=1 Tax=Halapricum sp. CBA1109 TaxID=2668068 RepID=UPI0012FA5F4F|nr:substrate-binding domain-containing protein [Halapricum sp. CBA1109]MUV89869.1 phosphate ABC transporter substrate-binding protein [Halapricum sp. CBA1109]